MNTYYHFFNKNVFHKSIYILFRLRTGRDRPAYKGWLIELPCELCASKECSIDMIYHHHHDSLYTSPLQGHRPTLAMRVYGP
jgi:hypothetical protein